MKDLIAKLEAASEGSRELDREIAVHPDTPSCGVVKGANVNVVREAEDNDPPIVVVPRCTISLDAKVLGENIIEMHRDEDQWWARHEKYRRDEKGRYAVGIANTEILARRIAGLKGMDAATEKDTKQ